MDLVLLRKLCQKFNPYLAQTTSSFKGLPTLNLRMGLTRIPIAVAMMEAYGRWIRSDSSLPKIQKSHPSLKAKHEKIKQTLDIDWGKVQWNDLRKPLHSGLAARLYLLKIPAPIPSTLTDQADYWKRYYNTESGAGTAQKFIDDVNKLEG